MNKAIIKRSYKGIDDDLIYMNRAQGYYFPCTNCVLVYDRKKDNVVICNELYDEDDTRLFNIPRQYSKLPEVKTLTVSHNVLGSIKGFIRESEVMDIKSFEKVDYFVMDGEKDTFYFSVDGKRKLIECDNFYMLYDGCKINSNADKVMRLVDEIEEILRKEVEDKRAEGKMKLNGKNCQIS